MLVLTRKAGERLILGDSIVVTVVRIDKGKVRLGIEAPSHVRVIRPEIQDRNTSPPAPLPQEERGEFARIVPAKG
jgi:carbon storage regulator